MKYVLVCICGSSDFNYDSKEGIFRCTECGDEIPENKAGYELLEEN
jgi:ribosomal protein S26